MVDQIIKYFVTLTQRQREIAFLLCDGYTNLAIAENLGISVHTVKSHRAAIMKRTHSLSFAELAKQIQQLRLTQTIQKEESKASPSIIVVEDDAWYRDYLVENLRENFPDIRGVADGDSFFDEWTKQAANIVILDIMLGSKSENGLFIASKLEQSNCGIIIVTSKNALSERIVGLQCGADAYLSKPVSIEELTLTINNLVRRL